MAVKTTKRGPIEIEITATTGIDGTIHRVGARIAVPDALAKDLFRRDRAVLASERPKKKGAAGKAADETEGGGAQG